MPDSDLRERLARHIYENTQGDDKRVSWEREKQIKRPYSLADSCYAQADEALAFLAGEGLHLAMRHPCRECIGLGKTSKLDDCPRCHGNGWEPEESHA